MTRLTTLVAAATLALSAFAGTVSANAEATVQVFYDLLSNPGSAELAEAFKGVTHDDWESIGNYSGTNKNRDQFLGQMGGFSQLMPDITWAVQDMITAGDTVVVRSRATATPQGPLFGVDGEGRGFDILTIDIHHLEDGKIARTYHVEDWASALAQLKGM